MSDKIQFFEEDIKFTLQDSTIIKSWIETIIQNYGKSIEQINYVFCSDEYLLEVNRTHLNHDYYTDIITFDMSDDESIEADIFISIDRVKDNAASQSQNFNHELHRVLIHGILHLLGFKDKTSEEEIIMREKEDSSLSLLKI